MRPIITFALTAVLAITFTSCWNADELKIRELKKKNPFKDNPDYISVYFKYDTIVDNYEVSGIFFPSFNPETKEENGSGWDEPCGVYMRFRNVQTNREYIYTDFDQENLKFRQIFKSKNISDICQNPSFNGFTSGDYYVFKYYTEEDTISETHSIETHGIAPLKSLADFQFLDIDFDDEIELAIRCNLKDSFNPIVYDVYDLSDDELILLFGNILSVSRLFPLSKSVYIISHDEYLQTAYRKYQVNKNGVLKLLYTIIYHWDNEEGTTYTQTIIHNSPRD